jgi:small-conductance mechanosensitive channel
LGRPGIEAEAGVYQDELVHLNATVAANARRTGVLTGEEPAGEKKDGAGGEIGKVRRDLLRVRTGGVQVIALKLGGILLAAVLVPWLIAGVVRRLAGGKQTGLMLSALGAVARVGVWVGAFALALSVLGFDVTAILAGLGIGGLAVGLAAQSMISDMIAALVIFAERKFKVGDVIRIGGGEPARVVGLSWRSTQLRTADGLVMNVPNQKVLQSNLQNLTAQGRTYDGMTVTVTTEGDAEAVLTAIRQALVDEQLASDTGAAIQKCRRKGATKVVQYQLWWLLTDYELRNRTRDAVFTRVGEALSGGEMKGTEVRLS